MMSRYPHIFPQNLAKVVVSNNTHKIMNNVEFGFLCEIVQNYFKGSC